MSSFGGFGANNNNNNTFGGFGSSNTGGFGANNNTSTGGSLFGGGTATTGGGGFSGFGANNSNNQSAFGAPKPAFGTSTTAAGGGVFGNNTTTSGAFGSSGGFGNTANTGGFGSNTGGSLFGQTKPATGGFGSTNTSGSLFGGGNTTGGFGSSTTAASNPFGANTNTNTFGNTNAGSGFAFGGGSNAAANNNNNGTGSTPFSATSEKESNTNQTSLYQSITFQQPYQNKSFEELRLEDYMQGRKYGNSNGQAGGFGQSTGFGGFGSSNTNTGGSLFGSNNAATTTNAFGGANNTNTNSFGGFGSSNNTGGSLFGSKPAGGSLFGQQSTAPATGGFGSTAGSGGNLFGNNSNSGFGANNTTTTGNNTAGTLFGGSNNQQQNKPAFGGFGSTNTAGGFGSNTNTSGSLFGNGNTNNTNTGTSLFGQNNQQQSNPFGATNNNSGNSLFGNANKPAGSSLFGGNTTTNTGSSLFGAQQNQQQSNPFGQPANNGGSLFGNQTQNKPAGNSLFGNSTNTSGSLFGAQNNQNSGTSLFGNNANSGNSLFGNQNKPAGGSLFGNNTSNNSTSLFGGNQQNQQNTGGSSLFGGLGQNNMNQQNTNGNSLFGGSLNQSQPANQLHASLTGSPYGNEQLFSSLAAPSPPVGPLATPLSGATPAARKTPSLLAGARVNTPVYSPRAGSFGRNGGYGFSYSTYGTPGSAYTSGSLTPGASSLLKPTGSLSSALTSRLNKSLSASNLRGDGEGRSLLRPGAFSPEGTPVAFGGSNVRKLKIDRSLRTDLFGPETKAIEAAKESDGPGLKKRVSFENAGDQANTTPKASASNAMVRTEEDEGEDAWSPGLIRAGPGKPQSAAKVPEMEQVNGAALSTVPEDSEAPRPSSAPGSKALPEKTKSGEVGDYWTKPAMKDLKNMSRQQLKNVGNFQVGREGVGRIEFGSVDLTNTPLEDICGTIVQLNPRSATVYQDDHDKPAMGKALNVPSTIYLENSWPRSHGGRKPVSAKSGREYEKHIARLKRVAGTHFVKYDADTGIWCFKVDHFTTYGLDDDDDESEFLGESQMMEASSPLSDAPATPVPAQDLTIQSVETAPGEMEDTFQFMLDRRSQLSVPGGFGSEGLVHDYENPTVGEQVEVDGHHDHVMSGGLGNMDMEDPFMSPGGPVQAPSPGTMERFHSSLMEEDAPVEEEEEEDEDREVPGSFINEPMPPRSILKPSTALSMLPSPEKLATEGWEQQLQRTLSPRKRDRQALKEMQQDLIHFRNGGAIESPFKQSILGQSALGQSYLAQKSAKKASGSQANVDTVLGRSQAFQTAMDLMESMYDQEKSGRKTSAGAKGFEYPYPKKPRLSNSDDAAWHASVKPNFSNNDTLVYAVPALWPQPSGDLEPALRPVVGEYMDVRFAKLTPAADLDANALLVQRKTTTIDISTGFPIAHAPQNLVFASLAGSRTGGPTTLPGEPAVWQLCSILYDELDISCVPFVKGIPEDQLEQLEPRIRLDALGAFWVELVSPGVQNGLRRARSAEEKALLHLTRNDVASACEALTGAKDFNLAMLVAQLPVTEQSQTMMRNQIEAWRNRNDWSEMSDAVRTLYSVLAGDLCVVEGKAGAAENRVAKLNIAESFGLTWQQSFALRLFFGGHDSIAEAVRAYMEDVDSGREKMSGNDGRGSERATILLEILRLYSGDSASPSLFDPWMASGSGLNWRLTWQLASLLGAKGYSSLSEDQMDAITDSFAMQLEAAGRLVNAATTLLHIHEPRTRQNAIVSLLNRHGNGISTPTEGAPGTFEQLAQDCQIPSTLLWRAKALYARGGLNDPALQAQWLLHAGDIDAAHEVLCTTVGPKAVIEQDYALLSSLLQRFEGHRVTGWERGGQVYVDYIKLLRVNAGPMRRQGADDEASLRRLKRGLAAMEKDGAGHKTLEERVAVIEMAKVLEEQERDGGMEPRSGSGAPPVVGFDMLHKYRMAMAG